MRSRKKRLCPWMFQSLVLTTLCSVTFALPEVIKVGGLFETSERQQELIFRFAIGEINANSAILPKHSLSALVKRVAPEDSFRALKTACDMFDEGVAALFGPPSPSTAGTLQSACDNLQIPYFQTHWDYRSKERSHAINLFPDTKTLATAFLNIIEKLEWKSFTIIYEDNEALMRLQEIVKTKTAKVKVRHVDPDQDYKKLIKDLKNSREYNFVVDLPLRKVQRLFADANQLHWMTTYQTYLLTTLDMHTVEWDAEVVKNPNITALRIIDPNNNKVDRTMKEFVLKENIQGRGVNDKQMLLTETALLYDGIEILASTLSELDKEKTIDLKSLSCESTNQWKHGSQIANYIKKKTFLGLSGQIKFDRDGKRTQFIADIMRLSTKGIPTKVGTWDPENGVNMLESRARGEQDFKELLKNATLRVSTIISPPYIMLKETKEGEVLQGNDRYHGFCVDIIQELADMHKFKFVIEVLQIRAYGDNVTGEWDGMIGKLLKREADLAIADLTITHKRESVVDFTLPFMTVGIGILFKRPRQEPPSLFSFLDPLSLEVWFCMATAFLGVSLLMFITARLSPYEWINPHPCDTEADVVENQYTLLNSFWFVVGSIMQQGSDILPRAISTRIIAISWWFFTMIMISSYTANLAAFLTAQRMKSPIENANDLAKQTKIEYGCVFGGSTMNFFKNSDYPIYKRMWGFMESQRPSVFTQSNEEGIDRVMKGNYAFLMESSSIEYQVERNCDLVKIGSELDAKGYGIATPPGSPYLSLLKSGVLDMQGRGRFHILKDKWWKVPGSSCEEEGAAPSAEMGIANVAGVFLVVAMGVVMGIIIVLIEFIWWAKKQLGRDPIPLMLWHELKHVFTRGSSRPVPKEAEEESVEKLPMMNLRTNPSLQTDAELFS